MTKDPTKHHFRCMSQEHGNKYCNCTDLKKVEDVAKFGMNILAEIIADLHAGVPHIDRTNGISTYNCKECKVESPCTTLSKIKKFTKVETVEKNKV